MLLSELFESWNEDGVQKKLASANQPIFTTDGRPITLTASYNGIEAFVDDKQAGYLELSNSKSNTYQVDLAGKRSLCEPDWFVSRAWVHHGFRRLGVATAMYDFAYRAGFRPLRRSKIQTPLGQAVWDKRSYRRSWELTEGRDAPLYHGTDIIGAMMIVKDGRVDAGSQYEHNPTGVSLTRDYHTALQYGTMWERDFPVVLVFDQAKIVQSPLKLLPRQDSSEPGNYREVKEFEEMVLGDLPLEPYLLSINIPPDEIKRAMSADGESYREYKQREGWDNLTRRKWLAGLKSLINHPKLNAQLHRHEVVLRKLG